MKRVYHLWLGMISLCSALVAPTQQLILRAPKDNDVLPSISPLGEQQHDHHKQPDTVSTQLVDKFDNPRGDSSQPTSPPHDLLSKKTIYELITTSKHTTILAKIVNDDKGLIQLLNSTKTNHTLFAPNDHAFHGKTPDMSKDVLRDTILYHVVPGVYPATSIFHHRTLSTAHEEPLLNSLPQRLTVRLGWRGISLNYQSRIIAIDICASNGIIHTINHVLTPPPRILKNIESTPVQFSTFTLGLLRTNLLSTLDTENVTSHPGGTIFAPSNQAFGRLGARTTAYLFSPAGEGLLRALLKYHIVPGRTLYSDVVYTAAREIQPFGTEGSTHLNLPTMLHDGELGVDVVRIGPYASLSVNGRRRVVFPDVLARDGNLFVVDRVLIPPKEVDCEVLGWTEEQDDDDEGIILEDLISRLECYTGEIKRYEL
ncbi:hypothetical protein EYZ11_003917 [Aspergillus tanneri]|uniref:FAS1 domain-containing protein n=1 Tax=Aspergillus tanneri TaxID=1220188 RepID=A0A4S3JMB2_9EURO|nr:uncharacterized protein ATNIH1004_000552 [Aspergillus tanneri]KAA8651661.1 hypothetical protein ATNIH1004_000552 [Aspergillus tanneri]THC96625.1 hypothetical protein EYZ11_003917 [Aspergillus tanneri]